MHAYHHINGDIIIFPNFDSGSGCPLRYLVRGQSVDRRSLKTGQNVERFVCPCQSHLSVYRNDKVW